jgi:hypothetical protein
MSSFFAVLPVPLFPDGALFISPGLGLLIVLSAVALVGGLLRYLNGPLSRPCSRQRPPQPLATPATQGDSKRRNHYRAAA